MCLHDPVTCYVHMPYLPKSGPVTSRCARQVMSERTDSPIALPESTAADAAFMKRIGNSAVINVRAAHGSLIVVSVKWCQSTGSRPKSLLAPRPCCQRLCCQHAPFPSVAAGQTRRRGRVRPHRYRGDL